MQAKQSNSYITDQRPQNLKPLKFILWVIIVSVIMMFAGLTSGYIVRKAEGNWVSFQMPILFWITTFIILLSSATMHWAYLSAKKSDYKTQKIALWITLVLGILFLVGQYLAWVQLTQIGIYLTGNPSGSFLYIISGLHGLHILAGVLLIASSLIVAYKNIGQVKNLFKIEICAIFWHFVDILWIYLFVFLLLNQ